MRSRIAWTGSFRASAFPSAPLPVSSTGVHLDTLDLFSLSSARSSYLIKEVPGRYGDTQTNPMLRGPVQTAPPEHYPLGEVAKDRMLVQVLDRLPVTVRTATPVAGGMPVVAARHCTVRCSHVISREPVSCRLGSPVHRPTTDCTVIQTDRQPDGWFAPTVRLLPPIVSLLMRPRLRWLRRRGRAPLRALERCAGQGWALGRRRR